MMQMIGPIILRAVLVILAGYHLGIGIISVTSLRLTARVTATLYGLAVVESPALRVAVRMLGLYALAIGTLLGLAALDPSSHREVIMVVAGLQLARAICRLFFGEELRVAFQLRIERNMINASLLVAEAVMLVVFLPSPQ
jgi:hypothetical protein